MESGAAAVNGDGAHEHRIAETAKRCGGSVDEMDGGDALRDEVLGPAGIDDLRLGVPVEEVHSLARSYWLDAQPPRLGGKVLVPTAQHVRTLNAARLAADVLGVPSLIVARTDALAADLLTSDIDPVDQPFVTGPRTDPVTGANPLRSGSSAARLQLTRRVPAFHESSVTLSQ